MQSGRLVERPLDVAQDRPFDTAQDRHCRYALDARTAQHLQQQRFRLIISMMRQRDYIARLLGKSRMAQFACRRLDAMLVTQAGDIDAFDAQRNVVLCTKSGAEIHPRIGVPADAVMDMQGRKLPVETWSKGMKQMQQHDRVHAAAQTNEDVTFPGKKRRQARRNSVS
jgi:hypothetical protein